MIFLSDKHRNSDMKKLSLTQQIIVKKKNLVDQVLECEVQPCKLKTSWFILPAFSVCFTYALESAQRQPKHGNLKLLELRSSSIKLQISAKGQSSYHCFGETAEH